MELLTRYRNVTVLLLVIFAQLVLLAYQVKGNGDVRLIRVWAVTAVTPAAKVVDTVRGGVMGVVENYFLFKDLRKENAHIKEELARTKLETQRLRTELETADRVHALTVFQSKSPSKTLTARVIATGTGANSRVVFLDTGSGAGVMRGMAVITPDGIVGKVIASYPTASQVLLITDPTFAAGVISQKHRVRGTVRGVGHGNCQVDYIQNEEQVDPGEMFFTSGDDGVFPRGLPVGAVTVVRLGNPNKQVFLSPSGLEEGLEEVLVVAEGVHQPVPEPALANKEVHIQPPPADQTQPPAPAGQQPAAAQVAGTPAGAQRAGVPPGAQGTANTATEADRLREKYKQLGDSQGHVFGTGLPGSKPPDFNLTPEELAARAARAKAAAAAKAQAGTAVAPGAAAPAETSPQAAPPKPVQPRPVAPTQSQAASPRPAVPPKPEARP
ncbi:MAG TPA: rod shape-determining protein MreC [Bryobacteraceae bacterium]|nr:rod shape-determining protein MreC [Bryobacteraceae bacterium]